LIPVSATGDFAVLDESRAIVKDPTKQPTPQNIEIPLIAIIPDVCRWALDVLAHAEEARRSGRDPQPSPDGVPPSTGNVTVGPFGVTIAVDTVARVAARLHRPVGTALRRVVRLARRQYRKRRVRDIHRIRSDEAALYYAIGVLTGRLDDFERAYPDSLLDAPEGPPGRYRLR
jgi:hypothetical protein